MKKKIYVVAGSRAGFGHLRFVMRGINDHPDLVPQIVAIGGWLAEDQCLSNKAKRAKEFGIVAQGASRKIVECFSVISLDSLIVKTFHDLAGTQK